MPNALHRDAPGTIPIGPADLVTAAARALDNSDNGLIILEPSGPDLIVTGINGAFCRVFGQTAQQAIGQPLSALAADRNDPAFAGQIAEAVAARRSLQTEMRCRTGAGASFWFGLHLMPPDAGRSEFVILGRDITERLQTRAQQRAVQQVLAHLFQLADAAVLVSSADATIFMTNPQCDRLFGYPAGALRGQPVSKLISPRADATILHARELAIAAGEPYTIESIGVRCDGFDLPLHVTSVLAHSKEVGQIRVVTLRELSLAAPAGPASPYQIAGLIRLVGLDEVKTALGACWPEMAGRVFETAEHVIAQNLAAGETFTRSQDDGFVICFAGRTEEEASFAVAMIGRRIGQRLLGFGEVMEGLQVTAITTAVEVPKAAAEGAAPIDMAELLGRRLNKRRLEIEARARRVLSETLSEAGCILAPVEVRDEARMAASYAALPAATHATLVAAHASLPADEQPGINIDAVVLGLAADRIHEGVLSGPVDTVFADVDFEVFRSRAALASYIDICRALQPVVRQRLFLMLAHLPHGVASSRLMDCAQRLRPFCRGIGFLIEDWRLAPSDPRLDLGSLIAIDATQVLGAGAEEKLMRLLAVVRVKRGRLLVRQVPGAAASLLRTAGVDLLAMAG